MLRFSVKMRSVRQQVAVNINQPISKYSGQPVRSLCLAAAVVLPLIGFKDATGAHELIEEDLVGEGSCFDGLLRRLNPFKRGNDERIDEGDDKLIA